MATLAEVDRAVHSVVERLAEVDPDVRRQHTLRRTVSCRVQDLDVVYTARVDDTGLRDLTTAPSATAQVRLRLDSDDLVALTEGRLAVPTAWATGRLHVEASLLDLFALRGLL